MQVYLVDDGSSDDTTAAVQKAYPSVHVITGDGSLYWNQGMRLAWESAVESREWDAFLWLNDDTLLLDGALESLFVTLDAQSESSGRPGIVVGSCKTPGISSGIKDMANGWEERSQLTYGGRNSRGLVMPTDSPQPVTTFNGNLVLVSDSAYRELGNLNPAYRHAYGDFDYGIRAEKLGIPICLAPGYHATCPRNAPIPWRDPNLTLRQRYRHFVGVKGFSVLEVREFQKTLGRGFWPLTVFYQYCFLLFPRIMGKLNRLRHGG